MLAAGETARVRFEALQKLQAAQAAPVVTPPIVPVPAERCAASSALSLQHTVLSRASWYFTEQTGGAGRKASLRRRENRQWHLRHSISPSVCPYQHRQARVRVRLFLVY